MKTTTTMRAGLVLLACGALASAACDTDFDPAPEVNLPNPEGGRFYPDTPIFLDFTEPVEADSLVVTVWSLDKCNEKGEPAGCNFTFENEFKADAKPLLSGCKVGSSCEGLTIALDEDGTRATISQGGAFDDVLGVPLMLDVHSGLSDRAGRTRDVVSRFPFQITPAPVSNAIDLQLNSGVLAMTADLSGNMPGVYLRMYLDVGIDYTTGECYIMATVGERSGDYPANDAQWDHMQPIMDETGWTISINGNISELDSGEFFLQTIAFDLNVVVLGIIKLEMTNLRLEGTIRPASTEDGRDFVEGIMLADAVLMGEGADQVDLGESAAAWQATGLFPENVPEGIPRVCADDPCATLNALGADCQVPSPWDGTQYCQDPAAEPEPEPEPEPEASASE